MVSMAAREKKRSADTTSHKHAQEVLRRAHEELESRVRERTSELAEANERLQAEIATRKRAEGALRQSQDDLRRSREELRALAAGLLSAQEEERRRVSRELHDDLNQRLAVLAVDVETLRQQASFSPDLLRGQLRRLQDRLVHLSEDVRRMACRLHPAILEHLGLPAALKSYCAEFSKREGIKVRFVGRDSLDSVPPDVALCVYRIAQEGLRNVAKHSGARRATIVLAGVESGIRLTITDRGVSFNPETAKRKGGLGLLGMGERVRLLAGSLSIKSRPGDGTRIDVRIPLPGSGA